MPLYNPDLGLISIVQKYSTKDGPGIRSTVFFKGCPLGCLWCSNPELIRSHPDLLYTREKCARCGTCIEACPRDTLSFGEEGFIVIIRAACDGCGDCVKACPNGALELIGKLVTVDELVTDLLKDRVFYQTSGGGVTFSGGEPLWQSGFVTQVARRMKEEGIHTALDTAGDVSWCHFDEVLDYIDLVLFDIKLAGREPHRQFTGRENDLILANAQLLSQRGVPMHIRLVMIPGINDSAARLRARMEIVSSLKSVQQVDILPYHRYGAGKYARLGLEYPLADLEEHTPEQIAEIQELMESYGIKTSVGG
ncbi:MAG: glycyl-radical enzyme activating protein [Anaerolineaceae bacterium]|nr:glycyl-radical enzyme activating protein [Anaerolineaceae bacterium]